MKKVSKTKRLAITTETVRMLDGGALERAVGGGTCTCRSAGSQNMYTCGCPTGACTTMA